MSTSPHHCRPQIVVNHMLRTIAAMQEQLAGWEVLVSQAKAHVSTCPVCQGESLCAHGARLLDRLLSAAVGLG